MSRYGSNGIKHKKEIRDQKDWDIVADLYQILVEENVINTQKTDLVIDFKYPNELKVCF